GTEVGVTPDSAWCPGHTIMGGVAQGRGGEFEAKYIGDWMLNCHLPHHMMNQMVSMVGPMMMSHGSGLQTGKGMQEGMGVVRRGDALSEDLRPGFWGGMGRTTQEENVSNQNGAPVLAPTRGSYNSPMRPQCQLCKK